MSRLVLEQVFSGAFEEAVRWCAWALMEAGYCLVVHARLCSVYCHAASAHKCKIRLICVLKTALDLAAGALCIEWGMGEAKGL